MIALALAAAALVALVIIYMARPRFERIRLSAARFFIDLPTATKGRPRLKLSNPLTSLPFWVQFLTLLAVFAALLSLSLNLTRRQATSIGLWLLVDTSASMSTRQGQIDRLAQAQPELHRALAQAQTASKDAGFCARLSAFDMERRDLADDAGQAETAIADLAARPLGTDVGLIRKVLAEPGQGPESDCEISHLVVISDLPAPAWAAEPQAATLIWRQVGSSVDNIGITDIQAERDPLTGQVYEIRVMVAAYGDKAPATLSMTSVDGSTPQSLAIDWQADSAVAEAIFAAPPPGRYTITLSPGGAYAFDDAAVIAIEDEASIRVDWQLSERTQIAGLGWAQDAEHPHLRVLSSAIGAQAEDATPLLVVGDGYGAAPGLVSEIADFYESSPLLDDLHFDVAETMQPPATALPAGFTPVLRSLDGRVWLAQRLNPPAAYVAGLPTAGDDDLERFTTTAFFNAVRWLLQVRDLTPLFTLTTPANPTLAGNRLALHEGEGDTQRPQQSLGEIDQIRPTTVAAERKPIWPLLLALAAGLFAAERILAAWRGERWR